MGALTEAKEIESTFSLVKGEDGKLVIAEYDKERYKAHADKLPIGLYSMRLKRVRSSGTRKQYGYYWGVVVPMVGMEIMGEDNKESVHEALKFEFAYRINEKTGMRLPHSTKEFDLLEFFNDYIDRIRRWAAEEYGVNIPDPSRY
jgi:hypothetical protein